MDGARRLANTATLGQLTSKVKNAPDTDLSDTLKQLSVSYPKLIESLRAAASESEDISNHHTDASDQRTPDPLYIQDGGAIEVICDLKGGIKELLAGNDADYELTSPPSEQASQISLTALHQALRSGTVLQSLHNNWVLSIGSAYVVKIGSDIDLDHIDNLRYINEHVPEIPTPQVAGAFRQSRWTFIFLSRAEGVTLEEMWPDLTTDQKTSVQHQLANYFQILRAKHPTSQPLRIGSFQTGTCKDLRRLLRVSPTAIYSESEFNEFLCQSPGRTAGPWISMVRSFLRQDHRIMMTHSDLHPRNIIVTMEAHHDEKSTINVSSILDWELAGWYPEYWEFVRALSTIDTRGPLKDWVEYLPWEAIGGYPVEYSLDCLIGRWVG